MTVLMKIEQAGTSAAVAQSSAPPPIDAGAGETKKSKYADLEK